MNEITKSYYEKIKQKAKENQFNAEEGIDCFGDKALFLSNGDNKATFKFQKDSIQLVMIYDTTLNKTIESMVIVTCLSDDELITKVDDDTIWTEVDLFLKN